MPIYYSANSFYNFIMLCLRVRRHQHVNIYHHRPSTDDNTSEVKACFLCCAGNIQQGHEDQSRNTAKTNCRRLLRHKT